MNQKYVDIVYVIGLVSLSVFLYYSTSLDYLVDGRPLFPPETQNLTGTYVRALSICLGGLSILLLIKTLRQQHKLIPNFIQSPAKFAALTISLVTYSILISRLGFFTSSAIFLPVTMFLMGYKRVNMILISSICLLLFIYVLFGKVFEVPLPEAELLSDDYARLPFDFVSNLFNKGDKLWITLLNIYK